MADFEDEETEQRNSSLSESGLLPDSYEFLEVASDGTPFCLREYSAPTSKLYLETIFQSVVRLFDDEISELEKAKAQNDARRLGV